MPRGCVVALPPRMLCHSWSRPEWIFLDKLSPWTSNIPRYSIIVAFVASVTSTKKVFSKEARKSQGFLLVELSPAEAHPRDVRAAEGNKLYNIQYSKLD